MEHLPEIIRASEAARRLGIHPQTLAKWSATGYAPEPIRVGPGNRRFYRVSDVESMLQDCGAQRG